VQRASTTGEQHSATGALPRRRLGLARVATRYVLDLGLLLASLWLARGLRLWLPVGKPLNAEGVALHAPMVLLAIAVWSVSLAVAHVYNPPQPRDVVGQLQAVAGAITVAALVYAGLLYLSYRGLSRLLYGYFYLLDLILTCGAHLLWHRHAQRTGAGRRRAALLGSSPEIARLAELLAAEGADRVSVVGLVSQGPGRDACGGGALPVLGPLEALPELISEHALDELVLMPDQSPAHMEQLLHTLQALPIALTLVPNTTQLVLSRASVETLGDLVLIGLNAPVIGPLDRALKRLLDISIALPVLLLLSPGMGMIAAAILADSGGPVLYRSRRLGEGERPFDMLKFRTMVLDADSAQQALVSTGTGGELRFAKGPDDPRVTRVGRFLRRWSLDELPQLVNVLRGEMSLVGPRPELPELAACYEPWQRRRFSVPQGMTGWWQVSGRSELPKAAHVEEDLHYIRNYSLLLDLQILWRTVGAVLRGRGAY